MNDTTPGIETVPVESERLAFPSTIAKQRAADLLFRGFPVTGAGLAKEVGCSTRTAMNALYALARHRLCKQDDLKPGDTLIETPFRQVRRSSAPSIEAARAMGAKGGPVIESERLAFEAWMQGHCWLVGGEWDGTTYSHPLEKDGSFIDQQAMWTRQLWAAWRDRAALSVPDDSKIEVANDVSDFDSPEHTGVGDWCAPGPAADQKRQWLLWFEDQDKGYQLYEDEAEARVAFARSETMGWNCHLFQHVPRKR